MIMAGRSPTLARVRERAGRSAGHVYRQLDRAPTRRVRFLQRRLTCRADAGAPRRPRHHRAPLRSLGARLLRTTTEDLALRRLGDVSTREARRALYQQGLTVIRNEFAGDIELPQLARRIGTSERALRGAFEENADLSFAEKVSATRLDAAAELLRETHLSVGAVARRVGCCDDISFARGFRSRHGVSPQAYARRERPTSH